MKKLFGFAKKAIFVVIGVFLLILASIATVYAMGYYQFRKNSAPVQSANINFSTNLSAYNIYQHPMHDLMPADDVHLLELSTPLFTDYSEKQRLVKLPEGTVMQSDGDGLPIFPDGTILVKTFYYYDDVRNPALGKRVIETRLEIKQGSRWDIVTYVWNDAQTEATLSTDGLDTRVQWITAQGARRNINYHVPSQSECTQCHKSQQNTVIPIGPKLRNLNRDVVRSGQNVNQLQHLQAVHILNTFDHTEIGSLPNVDDPSVPLSEKGRAYLEMNCAHCHHYRTFMNPTWQRLDFRYATSLRHTGILRKDDDIISQMRRKAMPFIGTTIRHDEGFALVQDYIASLR